ncbi:hypothetical protein F4808DRAFT_448373 [Astrocystis sublimbata]|nr:hypothetical protein F4808DRAFT_448373 [Astrocystis sublimbata]
MPPTTSHKRKLPLGGLQRRVRARREIEPDIEEHSEDSQRNRSEHGDSDDDMSPKVDDDSDDDSDDDPSAAVAQISFGALAKAQRSMPGIRPKKKGHKDTNESGGDGDEGRTHAKSSKPPKPQRAHKHAPTEMSSKRMVSRKREVVSAPKVPSRDPRFSSASGTVDEGRTRKAYAFLDEYRDAEMTQLRAAIKKTKSAADKEVLARELKSMQSKKEAQARRDAERDLVAQHRRSEKDLVAQGKKPFYLKKSEQKKQLLLDRFAGMKKKQVDKTIERRRKKLTSKEKKNMPFERRGAAL